MLLCFGYLALFAGQSCPVSVFAQSNTCPLVQPLQKAGPEKTRVIVDQVEFQGDNPLTESERADLATEIQQHSFFIGPGESEDDWAGEPTQVTVRGALQDEGYFRAVAEATPYLIRASEQELRYALRIRVESGPQYHLGDIRIVNAQDTPLELSETLLRQQIELQKGELFNASRIRQALETISRLYGSRGFIDATVEPDFSVDTGDSRIDLLLKVDEGKSYRISAIELLSSSVNAGKSPQLPQATGDPFNATLWHKFFEESPSSFSEGATFESTLKLIRNPRDSTIAVTVDFQSCPETPPPHTPGVVLKTKAGP